MLWDWYWSRMLIVFGTIALCSIWLELLWCMDQEWSFDCTSMWGIWQNLWMFQWKLSIRIIFKNKLQKSFYIEKFLDWKHESLISLTKLLVLKSWVLELQLTLSEFVNFNWWDIQIWWKTWISHKIEVPNAREATLMQEMWLPQEILLLDILAQLFEQSDKPRLYIGNVDQSNYLYQL